MPAKPLDKLDFEYGYEVKGVPPLPHYYEEILPHLKLLNQIGLRGDRKYLFHGKEWYGTAYYEKHEKKLSAEHTYKYFRNLKNRRDFFESIVELLEQTNIKIDEVSRLNLKRATLKKLSDMHLQLRRLDSWAFTYFLATQPDRLKLFENILKTKVEEKLPQSQVDTCLTELVLSEKPTTLSNEEMGWLELIINSRQILSPDELDIQKLGQKHPVLHKLVHEHYEKYKNMSLGDSVWHHSINYFINNLKSDYGRDIKELKTRLNELKNFKDNVLQRRRHLIKVMSLNSDEIRTAEFLADMGHYRFSIRIDGFIPLIHASLMVLREIERRVGIKGDELLYLTDESELQDFSKDPSREKIQLLKKRIPPNHEFVQMINNGKYSIYFGAEAAMIFKRYVGSENHFDRSEVSGNVAMTGRVKGTVTVYQWGDDMQVKLKEIKNHPILIAGHTRPAMMPLIRLAKGIVTDEGGITSHAAIVSRELGIPSIIGTKTATKVFKTGDSIDLDAENGIVRKIQTE